MAMAAERHYIETLLRPNPHARMSMCDVRAGTVW